MVKINYKSDFIIKERPKTVALEVPFVFSYYVFDNKKYVASFDGNTYVNCERKEDGSLDVIFNSPGFGVGRLKVERKYSVDDKAFVDGVYDIVTVDDTDVFITSGKTFETYIETLVVPPYIKGDKGDPMTWSGMTEGEQSELVQEVMAATQEAQLVEQVTGNEKISVSDGSGLPKAITTEQIKNYIEESKESSSLEFVDLGLPSGNLWATRNIGARSSEDSGLFFAWGETEGYNVSYTEEGGQIVSTTIKDADGNLTERKFTFADYKWSNGTWNSLTKYNTNSSYGVVDNLSRLLTDDDAAYAVNNTYRIPSVADFEELIQYTTFSKVSIGSKKCGMFTAANGNYVIFPITGTVFDQISSVNSAVYYPTCEIYPSNPSTCKAMLISDYSELPLTDFNSRCTGLPVRAVKSKETGGGTYDDTEIKAQIKENADNIAVNKADADAKLSELDNELKLYKEDTEAAITEFKNNITSEIENILYVEGGYIEEVITQNDLKEDEYKQIDNNYRGYYAFEVGSDDFTLTLSVLSSSIKCAVHRTENPGKWSSFTKDSGWVNSGETKSFDKTFGTGNYIRLIVTNVSGSGMPDFDTMKTSIQLEFNKTHYQEPGLAEKLDDLEEEMSDLHGVKELVEKGESDMNINIISGKALNTVNGLHSSTLYELIDYIDVSKLENVKIKSGFWNSDKSDYSTLIELYDESKTVIKRIIPSELIGLTDIQWAYVFDGLIDVSDAYYIRFCNLVSVPASNKNTEFILTTASCKKTIVYKTEDVIDYELMKNQSEINKEINYVLYGNRSSDSKVELTINELKDNYSSTTEGGGRGFFNIEISAYDKYNVYVKFKANPIVKAAVTIKRNASYGSNIYDTGWFTSGYKNITETTATTSGGKYIGLVFTYTSGSGVPTVEEIAQSVDINFVGTILGDFGLQGKVEDLEKIANGTIVQETIISTKYDNPIGTSKYHGLKVDIGEHEFSWENIGKLGSGTGSRQGGALYGNYLFQFHDGLASVVVYNLETKTTVQVLTPSVSIRTHAGSGGFSKEFYDESDTFPILYISSMYEDVVQAYRITGIEGEFTMELVQTLILNIPAKYVNITVDADNNKLVMFGYQKASWSDSADNMSVICSCSLPSVKEDDIITINKVDSLFYIPFIYAAQGAFARFGKLYLSFGNTISIAGMLVIDYVKRNVDTFVDFGVTGNWEPEAFCHYQGNILVTSQSGTIYKLSF